MAQGTDTETIVSIVNKYLNLLRESHISFEQVYLYGSYAKGNPQEDSDIDLAIIDKDWVPDVFDAQF
ncbi:MAG: nucleotidyltransferase domain-containing protein [bacterium]